MFSKGEKIGLIISGVYSVICLAFAGVCFKKASDLSKDIAYQKQVRDERLKRIGEL